jgi:hypothetical protein
MDAALEHHADFAVAISHRVWVETSIPREAGGEPVAGWAIALGWWVDPEMVHTEQSTGTLYLVVDERGGPPVWIAEGNIRHCRVSFEPA